MNPHRGLLHHMIINVSNLKRSAQFYGPLFTYLGYERAEYQHEGEYAFEDWKLWLEGTPHEISIVQAQGNEPFDPSQRRLVGNHHHIAFNANDRQDIDDLYTKVLVPLEKEGLCVVEDPPCECPEYGEGYYATYFFDPDALKYEFVTNPNYFKKLEARNKSQ